MSASQVLVLSAGFTELGCKVVVTAAQSVTFCYDRGMLCLQLGVSAADVIEVGSDAVQLRYCVGPTAPQMLVLAAGGVECCSALIELEA